MAPKLTPTPQTRAASSFVLDEVFVAERLSLTAAVPRRKLDGMLAPGVGALLRSGCDMDFESRAARKAKAAPHFDVSANEGDRDDAAVRNSESSGGVEERPNGRTRSCPMNGDDSPMHPVRLFRDRMRTEIDSRLPYGVAAIPEWCDEPNFFPAASGMPTSDDWSQVVPGITGANSLPPVATGERDVVVVGNYQATVDSYRRMRKDPASSFRPTWRSLRVLMHGVQPRRTFLTNAHIGLPCTNGQAVAFPTTAEFLQACADLLKLEIESLRPGVVVCLGRPASVLVSGVIDGLDAWRPWSGFSEIVSNGYQRMPSCRLGDLSLEVVTVRHPSAVLSRSERESDARVISQAVQDIPNIRRV